MRAAVFRKRAPQFWAGTRRSFWKARAKIVSKRMSQFWWSARTALKKFSSYFPSVSNQSLFSTKKRPFCLVDNFIFMLFFARPPHMNFCIFFFPCGSNLSWFNHTFDVFPSVGGPRQSFLEGRQTQIQKSGRIVKIRGGYSDKVSCRLLDFLWLFGACEKWVVRRSKSLGRWVGKFWQDVWTVWCMIQCFLV